MTLAICIRSGEKKIGALTRCAKCGFKAEQTVDQARSLLLTDHYLAHAELETLAQKLKCGEQVQFDEASLSELAQTLEQFPDRAKMPLGCYIVTWTPVVIVIVLALLLVGLLIYLRVAAL